MEMEWPHFLSVHGVDGWDHGFRPLQLPAQSMVDGEAISSASIVIAFRPLLLDLVEPGPPLRIRMLGRVSNEFNTNDGTQSGGTLKDAARPLVMSPTIISG